MDTLLEPDGRAEDDRRLLLVPVRSGRCGSIAVRTGRLPDGRRVGLAFTCEAALAAVFGADQSWIPLNARAARAMFADAGAEETRVDAVAFVPAPEPVPQGATAAIAPKPLAALRVLQPHRRAGARIRLAARHAH